MITGTISSGRKFLKSVLLILFFYSINLFGETTLSGFLQKIEPRFSLIAFGQSFATATNVIPMKPAEPPQDAESKPKLWATAFKDSNLFFGGFFHFDESNALAGVVLLSRPDRLESFKSIQDDCSKAFGSPISFLKRKTIVKKENLHSIGLKYGSTNLVNGFVFLEAVLNPSEKPSLRTWSISLFQQQNAQKMLGWEQQSELEVLLSKQTLRSLGQ